MDNVVGARMAEELIGSEVSGWKVEELLGVGKSALVLRAEKDEQRAALKIFDPDLIKRYGESVQLSRIEREKRLIGKSHEHVVKIFDGGKCPNTGHLFVAMEYIPEKDLSQLLTAVPRDRIRLLISQLALAARFLHEQELAHRDIKPSNIIVSNDFQHLTLLDLGVLRPFGEAGLTDLDGQHFTGTLQYSSPEFLFRQEQDTPEGWLALAFYQVGAVLHDLLKQKTIFEEYLIPYSRTVEAVKYTAPDLDIPGADADLVALAQVCLVKDPAKRLKLVTWDSFTPDPPLVSTATIKDRVKKRQATATPATVEEPTLLSRALALNEVMGQISTMIRAECRSNAEVFPQVEVHDHPPPNLDSIAFRVAFPEATERGLNVPFALLFGVQLIDLAAKIVEVSVSCAVSGDVRSFPCNAFSESRMIYQGPFNNPKLKTRIDYALYAAVEAVISRSPLKTDETKPLQIDIPERAE